MNSNKTAISGGEFLIRDIVPKDIFIPEEWNEEQQMIADMCREFIEQKINPNLDRIDTQEAGLMESLLDAAGELGLLGVSVPRQYGGLGKDFLTAMLVTENMGAGHSFAVAFAAHTGIGTLPILYYGNEAQKKKYIPKLATGAWKGAYCLTEPNAGSDANSGKTKAVLQEGGTHYLLNGQKMWITNAGFADLFTVFAKIGDDDDLSAFIVEKSFGGIELGAEEKKMGIKGSSTRQVFFNDCPVPAENLLSERGNGFKIAVNILNLGRIKLGGAALGAAKKIISRAVHYAGARSQFGRSISKYGAIKHKLAEQAIKTYASEAAIYRASYDIGAAIAQFREGGMAEDEARLKGTEQFAIEAAIIKVHASEMLDYVVDEGVQIYGGMGYSAEAPMDRSYRDARINRIFEGTNEINRLLVVEMMLKRALKGELDLMGAVKKVAGELLEIPDFSAADETAVLAREQRYIKQFKKAVLMTAGAAVEKLKQTLVKEQEVLMYLADMLIEVYVCESLCLRVAKLILQETEDAVKEQIAMAQTYVFDAAAKIHFYGRNAINAFATTDERQMMQMGLRRYTKTDDYDTTAARRLIAKKLIARDHYCF